MSKNHETKAPFIAQSHVPVGTRWQGTFPSHVFSLTLSGGAEYWFPGGKQEIGPGDFLHFAPQAWQDWRVTEDTGWEVHYIIVELPTGLSDLLPDRSLAPGIGIVRLDADEAARVADAFLEMLSIQQRSSPLGDRIIINVLEHTLLLMRERRPGVNLDPRIEKARAFLHRSCVEMIALSDVAQASGLSKARLCALFKSALSLAPMAYLEEIRMERAARLLRFTATDIETISQQLGYHERKYFDKRFKRRWGVTPRQYRLHGGTGDGQSDKVRSRKSSSD